MGRLLRAGHTAINVRDAEASYQFYAEVLGLPVSEPVAFDGYRIRYARLPDGSQVELFDFDQPPPEGGGREERTVGLRHLAFVVDDLDQWAARLREHGVVMTLEVTELPALGLRVLLCLDPNGVTLELAQPLPAMDAWAVFGSPANG